MGQEIEYIRAHKKDIQWCLVGAIGGLLILGYLVAFAWTTESDYVFNSQEVIRYEDTNTDIVVLHLTDTENGNYTIYRISGIDAIDANTGDTIRIKWCKGKFAGYKLLD